MLPEVEQEVQTPPSQEPEPSPSPSEEPADSTEEAADSAAPVPSPTPSAVSNEGSTPEEALGDTPDGSQTTGAPTRGVGTRNLILMLLALPCALLATFLVLLIRRCIIRRRRKKSFYVESTNQAVLNLWQYAQRLALWGAEPTQAQQDLALKAKFSQHTITPEELEPYRQEILHTAALTRLTLSRWKKFRFTWLSCLDWKEA